MAKLFPDLDMIKSAKQKPTEGELYLLQELLDNILNYDNKAEIYFQPFFNGERPDIVLIHKDRGIIIIEVKDWDLNAYELSENNEWIVKHNNCKIKSPFAQVFGYKKNMFDLHINGLYEKYLFNKNFYNAISCFVYFHKATKEQINKFYNKLLDQYKTRKKEVCSRGYSEERDKYIK